MMTSDKDLPRTPDDYLPFLTRYLEEEIGGVAYFAALADRFSDPRHKEALRLLSEIEAAVVDAVDVLRRRHRLALRDESTLRAKGAAGAATAKYATWPAFVDHILTRFPDYIDEFAALEAVAPEADKPLLKPFTDHEIAAIRFAEREKAGDPGSLDELSAYLETSRLA